MRANIFRCGWCGSPSQRNGKPLEHIDREKVIRIIEKYGDYRTVKVNGWCCSPENI